jgi:hypothetical protein
MKKHLFTFLLIIIIAALAVYIFRGSLPEINNLNREIDRYQGVIDSLENNRDTIIKNIERIEIIRDSVIIVINNQTPGEVIQGWDSITGGQSQIISDSLVITPLPSIVAGSIALHEKKLLKDELLQYQLLARNQSTQIELQKGLIESQSKKITRQRYVIAGFGVVAIISLAL